MVGATSMMRAMKKPAAIIKIIATNTRQFNACEHLEVCVMGEDDAADEDMACRKQEKCDDFHHNSCCSTPMPLGIPVPPEQRVWSDADLEKIDKHIDFMREQKRYLRNFIKQHYTKDLEFVTTQVTTDDGNIADCIEVGVAACDMEFMRELLKSKPETVTVQVDVRRKTELDLLPLYVEKVPMLHPTTRWQRMMKWLCF